MYQFGTDPRLSKEPTLGETMRDFFVRRFGIRTDYPPMAPPGESQSLTVARMPVAGAEPLPSRPVNQGK